MNERRSYLPDIPLLPEEREVALKAGKPKLPGAPGEAHESALLALEEGLPLLSKVGADLKAYAEIKQNEKKKRFKYEKIRHFINNPRELEAYFDTLRVLSESWKERHDEIETYINEVLDDLEKFVDVGTLSPKTFQEWLSIAARSEIYRPIAERVFTHLFEKARSPQALIDILYNLTIAILSSSDKEVLKKGLEISTFQAPFLRDDPKHFLNNMKALLSLNDDELLRRTMEVDFATHQLAKRYMPDALDFEKEYATRALQSPEYQEFIARIIHAHPDKYKMMMRYYNNSKPTEAVIELNEKKVREWPYTLVFQGGRVRELINDFIATESGGMINLCLPMDGRWIVSLHKIDSIASDIYFRLHAPSQGNTELRDQKFIKSLFYLTPDISPEKKVELSEDVVALREEINREKAHSISPRGDKILIVDDGLKTLGFKSITFRVAEHAPVIVSHIEVGNYFFVATLNQDFEILDGKGGQLPGSFEQKAFIEDVILSHLKELMCTERVKPGNGENGRHNGEANGKQLEREIEFKNRRPHLRKLPPNHAYSREALAEGLLDPLRYDLARINAELRLTRETGQKTYVKVSIKPTPGEAPLISRAPHATDRLKRILAETGLK